MIESEDDKAQRAANDANLAGIIAGRRKAAAALLAKDPAPAAQVRENFAAIAIRDRGGSD